MTFLFILSSFTWKGQISRVLVYSLDDICTLLVITSFFCLYVEQFSVDGLKLNVSL